MFRDTIAIIKKGISKGVEWHKFQLCSNFQWGVMNAKRDWIKLPYYSYVQTMVFGQKRKISISVTQHVIRKGMKRGTEWHKF